MDRIFKILILTLVIANLNDAKVIKNKSYGELPFDLEELHSPTTKFINYEIGYRGNIRNSNDNVTCPADDVVSPCYCKNYKDNPRDELHLYCPVVDSQEDLSKIFKRNNEIPNKQFDELRISTSTAVHFDQSSENISFRKINLFSGPFPNLLNVTNEFLKSSVATLEFFFVYRSKLNYFPFASLPDYKKLDELHIHFSELTSLPPIKSNSLEIVAITSASISEITTDTFKETKNVRIIDLYGNKIKELKPNTIPITKRAHKIILDKNGLETIAPGAFYQTEPLLKTGSINDGFEISLKDNNLKTVDKKVFGPIIDDVFHLGIGGNPLECGCDILWIVSNPIIKAKILDDWNPARCADSTLVENINPEDLQKSCPSS